LRILDFKRGQGSAVAGQRPQHKAKRTEIALRSPDALAVGALGQLDHHPRVGALRAFLADWYVVPHSFDQTRAHPDSGPQERLRKTGDTPKLIGLETPEKSLHPRLLPELAKACRDAATHSQVFAATHSPLFVNGLRPEELRVLYRNEQGYTQTVRASDLRGVQHFIDEGATLGSLWLEGHFGVGDPLVRSGGPARVARRKRGGDAPAVAAT
jgi:predicted ATPase